MTDFHRTLSSFFRRLFILIRFFVERLNFFSFSAFFSLVRWADLRCPFMWNHPSSVPALTPSHSSPLNDKNDFLFSSRPSPKCEPRFCVCEIECFSIISTQGYHLLFPTTSNFFMWFSLFIFSARRFFFFRLCFRQSRAGDLWKLIMTRPAMLPSADATRCRGLRKQRKSINFDLRWLIGENYSRLAWVVWWDAMSSLRSCATWRGGRSWCTHNSGFSWCWWKWNGCNATQKIILKVKTKSKEQKIHLLQNLIAQSSQCSSESINPTKFRT